MKSILLTRWAHMKAVGPYTFVIHPGWGSFIAGVIIPGRTMHAGIFGTKIWGPHSPGARGPQSSVTIESSAQAFVRV